MPVIAEMEAIAAVLRDRVSRLCLLVKYFAALLKACMAAACLAEEAEMAQAEACEAAASSFAVAKEAL